MRVYPQLRMPLRRFRYREHRPRRNRPERLDTDIREGDLGTEPSNTSDSGFFEMTPPHSETDNLNSGDMIWHSPQIPATTRSPVPTSSS